MSNDEIRKIIDELSPQIVDMLKSAFDYCNLLESLLKSLTND